MPVTVQVTVDPALASFKVNVALLEPVGTPVPDQDISILDVLSDHLPELQVIVDPTFGVPAIEGSTITCGSAIFFFFSFTSKLLIPSLLILFA